MNQGPAEPRDGSGVKAAGVKAFAALRRIGSRIAYGLPIAGRRPPAVVNQESANPLAAFNRYSRAYFQRWLLIGALIGVVAGLGAIVFTAAIAFMTHTLLGGIAGFTPPSPAGEGKTLLTPIGHRWLL
ncbi:MAG TPA: hypothetical protein VJN88_17295, partial [Ktedonobacterales bacterium]|nr:hypothetical protein [Ktedonobacterales bacterium]